MSTSDPSCVGALVTFGAGVLTLGTVSSYFLLSYLGLYGVLALGVFNLGVAVVTFLSVYSAVVLHGVITQVTLFKWFALTPGLVVSFSLYIDTVSYSFALLTLLIALFVQLYAFTYFRYEPNVDRLLVFLNSFVASMVLLVLAGNLVVLFLGWELIGLTSFLLINFWSTRVGTLKAAFKAFSFNKLSDFFLFIALILAAMLFNTFDIPVMLTLTPLVTELRYENVFECGLLDLFVLALLGAAFIKSAQLGGHV
jgi:NADH-quinone oxidoreductase subunit L